MIGLYNISRKKLIVAGLMMAALLAVGIWLLIGRQDRSDPSLVIKTVNKDTGEVLYTTPNITQEKESQAPGGLIIFGGYLIAQAPASPAQFSKTKDLLQEYSQKVLNNKYRSLTIVPDGIIYNQEQVESRMRLGSTDRLVRLRVDLSKITFVRVIIDDPSGQNGGFYDSSYRLVDYNLPPPVGD